MDFAPSSIRLTASGVEMSGFGAPVLTATPTATVASGVALPRSRGPTRAPRETAAGRSARRTARRSPPASSSRGPIRTSPSPCARSSSRTSGIIFSIAALTPPGPTSVILVGAGRVNVAEHHGGRDDDEKSLRAPRALRSTSCLRHHARPANSRVSVWTFTFSPSLMKSGTRISRPVSSVAGLVDAAAGRVAADARLGVR